MRKITIFLLVFIIIPIFIALALGEIYIRCFSLSGYITPEIKKNRALRYEESVFSKRAFRQQEHIAEGWDGLKYYINEKGYRGNNFTVKKPEGAIRIIFYGGSSVFDLWVPEGKDWPHRVEEILRQRGFPEAEVINAGIPGYTSSDSLGSLFAEGHIFSPDYVILYNAWNDIKYFRSDKPLLRHSRPYHDLEDPRVNYQGRVDRFLCEHSQLYVRLRHRYLKWRWRIGPEGTIQREKRFSKINELGPRQYELNINMFVDLARNIGAEPILMTQARLVDRENTPDQRKRIFYDYQLLTHQALCGAFEKTDEIIYRIAKEKGVFPIDASKYLSGRDELFRDHTHLTDKGSEEIADLTAEYLAELLRERELKAERISEDGFRKDQAAGYQKIRQIKGGEI